MIKKFTDVDRSQLGQPIPLPLYTCRHVKDEGRLCVARILLSKAMINVCGDCYDGYRAGKTLKPTVTGEVVIQ